MCLKAAYFREKVLVLSGEWDHPMYKQSQGAAGVQLIFFYLLDEFFLSDFNRIGVSSPYHSGVLFNLSE